MEFKSVLVDLAADDALTARLDAAMALAGDSGRVIGLTATGQLLDPYRSAGEETLRYQAMRADMLRGVRRAGEEALLDAIRRRGATVDSTHVVAEQDAGWALTTRGMTSDIVLPGLPGAPSELPPLMASPAEYALVNAGKPILVVPPAARMLPIGTAVVAWNGRREAARAIGDAIPLLKLAERVIVHVVIGRSGPWEHSDGELVRWLAGHGIKATVEMEESSSAAERLLEKVLLESAGLLVAGGYGHSRLGELVMGGTTRTLLHNTPVPLLMSH
ncbi:universal stress protein [Cupriavidus pauculus]|uniref:universal stress protein n=1 Tax=Cupriavidus pauculus TaxID=82633 RepID=UPI0007810B02|nr:universal stress protein [Cupriavidus pauculus]